MLYKYSNFELKLVFLFNRPVTDQTRPVSRANRSAYRLKSFELAFEFEIWICPVLIGFWSNRSGLPEPVGGGLVWPVGKKTLIRAGGAREHPCATHFFPLTTTRIFQKKRLTIIIVIGTAQWQCLSISWCIFFRGKIYTVWRWATKIQGL